MQRLIAAALFAALALSGPAFADRNHPQDGKAGQKAHKEHYKAERKAAKAYEKAYRKWARGERLPAAYLAAPYYVDDYRAYRLYAPPAGHRWVRPYQDDETYYLVQIATGLISEIFGG